MESDSARINFAFLFNEGKGRGVEGKNLLH